MDPREVAFVDAFIAPATCSGDRSHLPSEPARGSAHGRELRDTIAAIGGAWDWSGVLGRHGGEAFVRNAVRDVRLPRVRTRRDVDPLVDVRWVASGRGQHHPALRRRGGTPVRHRRRTADHRSATTPTMICSAPWAVTIRRTARRRGAERTPSSACSGTLVHRGGVKFHVIWDAPTRRSGILLART
jgi:hypothetical protein